MKKIFFTLVVIAMAAGCSRTPTQFEAEEEKNPYFVAGMRKVQAHDYPGAKTEFGRALEIQPNNARAHFELALLLDGDYLKPNDYVGAVYHYQKFLELQPQSEKAEVVRGRIASDIRSIAASVPHSDVVSPQELASLQSENAALRQENEQFRFRLEQLTGKNILPPTSTPQQPSPTTSTPNTSQPTQVANATAPIVPTTTAAPTNVPRQYVVQKGDTLSSIARKLFGSAAAAEKIYAANRATVPDKNALVVGQVLTIPAR